MRRVLLPILVASLLLLSRASLGAAQIPDFDGHGESGLSLRLRLLPWGEDRGPRWLRLAPSAPAPGHLDGVALVGRSLIRAGPARELRRRLTDELSERLKRPDHELPLSIDLHFHLLRHLLGIAKAASQKEQAEENRLILDSVGK
ncbi:urocortin [Heteronotia binoei]|uniref:urocortin n=1 Tax=Heteronotia binoei TaxID=13085 RepID=UPI00292D1C4F|nr:urocortin [Heteronotia binoei]